MNVKKKRIALIIGAMIITGFSWAQCKQVKWPENKSKAEECVVIWGDAVKTKEYRRGTGSLQWMLKNAPDWHLKLYVDATKTYNQLAKSEKDPAKKRALVDTLMNIYDMRIKHCGGEVNVLNRKAFAALRYNVQNKEHTANVLALYDKVYEKSGNKVMTANLSGYMSVIQANWALLKNLTEEDVLSRYEKLSSVIDAQINNAEAANKTEKAVKLKSIKVKIDEKLTRMVKVDCEFVKKNLEPRFEQNPDDADLAKKIFTFMTKDGCISDPLWLKAAEKVHETSPDYGLAINMAKICAKNGESDRAKALALEASSLGVNAKQKEEASLLLGDLYATSGKKIEARKAYRKAIADNSESKTGYEKIGDLYMNSFADCSKKQSLAEDRLVYIAAYNMYARAGSRKKMSAAKAQFPSTVELFEQNWQEGQTKSISCWIGETVSLKTRGKE